MAVDQGLLDLAERGTACLRLYRWHPSCLSFGRNEPALRRYDRDHIESLGLDTVRRPTGGRAVWHAEELTYAVACPAAVFGQLPAAYEAIHRTLAGALRHLGVAAGLAERPGRPARLDAGACFASPAGGEVVVGGRKVVGSAQVRQGDAMLQHGSVLLRGNQDPVARATRGVAAPSLDVALDEFLGGAAAFDAVAAAIADAAAEWPGGWRALEEPADALAAAAGHEARFRSPDWTWRR